MCITTWSNIYHASTLPCAGPAGKQASPARQPAQRSGQPHVTCWACNRVKLHAQASRTLRGTVSVPSTSNSAKTFLAMVAGVLTESEQAAVRYCLAAGLKCNAVLHALCTGGSSWRLEKSHYSLRALRQLTHPTPAATTDTPPHAKLIATHSVESLCKRSANMCECKGHHRHQHGSAAGLRPRLGGWYVHRCISPAL
jgi:hypothetical protein